jgi:hypothetical protein
MKEGTFLAVKLPDDSVVTTFTYFDGRVSAPVVITGPTIPLAFLIETTRPQFIRWASRVSNDYHAPVTTPGLFEAEIKKSATQVIWKYAISGAISNGAFTHSSGQVVFQGRAAYEMSWSDWSAWLGSFLAFIAACETF